MLAAVRLISAAELDAKQRSAIDLLAQRHPHDAPRLLRPDWDRVRVSRVFAVIEANGEPAGLVCWSGMPDAALPWLWIRPGRRRQGLGRRAIELLAPLMLTSGVERLSPDISADVPTGDGAVPAAADRLLQRLRELIEPPGSAAPQRDWPRAFAALRTRYPKATASTLFCLFKLEDQPALTTRSFRDEAASHGIAVSGRALHVARQLLSVRSRITKSNQGHRRASARTARSRTG